MLTEISSIVIVWDFGLRLFFFYTVNHLKLVVSSENTVVGGCVLAVRSVRPQIQFKFMDKTKSRPISL